MSQEKTSKHSIKVPKLYKVATSILKDFKNGQGSIKTLVYDARKKHPNVKALLALVNECVRYENRLLNAFNDVDLLKNEKPLDQSLALILATELLIGKKTLPGESKPILTLLRYQSTLEKSFHSEKNVNGKDEIEHTKFARYVRVNLLKTTLDLVLTHFKREGLTLKDTPDAYDEFCKEVVNLKEDEFMIDFHLKDYLLIFPPKTQFYDYPLYLDGSLVLQDKASCLTVAALNPTPGKIILDACAAPGMKTSQALAMVQPEGKVIAIERNAKRYKVLNELLQKHSEWSEDAIETKNADFLQLNPEDFSNVEYLIVDPTCSGSGLSKVEKDPIRLSKLANLQVMILKHALKFPSLKRVAYSTCSIFVEENEAVVEEVLKQHGDQFKLVNVLPTWERRTMNDKCLRVDPDKDLTSGFFVAVFKKKK